MRSVANMKWSKHVPIVIRFLKGEQTKYVPKVVQQFGKENFKLSDNTLFLFGREIVIDKKRKLEILDKEEGRYGGVLKASSRVRDKFIGISRQEIADYFGGSERRQLKARYQKQKANETFIHARNPGTLQIDMTLYNSVRIFAGWYHLHIGIIKHTLIFEKSVWY